MGLFAIRVFAAGALLDAEPSSHTLKTPFFPLALYQRDVARVRDLQALLNGNQTVREIALRYVLSQPEIASAIIGFGAASHVEESLRLVEMGRLTEAELSRIEELVKSLPTQI